jgi:hypothetical protein
MLEAAKLVVSAGVASAIRVASRLEAGSWRLVAGALIHPATLVKKCANLRQLAGISLTSLAACICVIPAHSASFL